MTTRKTDPGVALHQYRLLGGANRLLLIVVMAIALCFTPVAVYACGNPIMWAMLFAKVPEAKMVYEAELSARADGLVTARVYNAKPGQPYHLWSKAWIMELAAEMQAGIRNKLEGGAQLTVLLADEVAALRFTSGREPQFIPAAGLRTIERFDLITTTNALKSVWRDGLSRDELFARDLAWRSQAPEAVSLSRVLTVN